MPRINIYAHPAKAVEDEADSKRLEGIEWPVVPLKGQNINLGPRGCTGVDSTVFEVSHFIGTGDIDVHCRLLGDAAVTLDSLRNLCKEDGWKE